MATIHHRVWINAPVAKVYEACFRLTGAHFIFELAGRGDSAAPSGSGRHRDRTTTSDFRQVDYDEQSEFFGSNDLARGRVLQNLKQVVESRYSEQRHG